MARTLEDTEVARRAFLAKCGKYALITPPVVTLMLSASGKNNYALALSGSLSGSAGAGAAGGAGGGISTAGGGGGGSSGPLDPGILRTSGGSGGGSEAAGGDIICRTSRATPTSWRETACTRPSRRSFGMPDGPDSIGDVS